MNKGLRLYKKFFYESNHFIVRIQDLMNKAGEKMFVDFSGDKPYYIDPSAGEIIDAELFIAVLEASSSGQVGTFLT